MNDEIRKRDFLDSEGFIYDSSSETWKKENVGVSREFFDDNSFDELRRKVEIAVESAERSSGRIVL
jgi:hypothetical protein